MIQLVNVITGQHCKTVIFLYGLPCISIYTYNSVVTCRHISINSSASAPLNAMNIAVKNDSDVDVVMFGPEL